MSISASHARFSWIDAPGRIVKRRHSLIAVLGVLGITLHLVLRFVVDATEYEQKWPLWGVLLIGGVPLTAELVVKLFRREFGSDLLAGISIVRR